MGTGISLQYHEVSKVYFNIENAELARANKNTKHCQKKRRATEALLNLVGLSRLFPFGLSSQAPMWSRCARLELRSSHLHSPRSKKPRIREALLNLVGLSRFELLTSTMSR